MDKLGRVCFLRNLTCRCKNDFGYCRLPRSSATKLYVDMCIEMNASLSQLSCEA